jgi:hypothetical protein
MKIREEFYQKIWKIGRAVGGDEVLFSAYSANYTDDRSPRSERPKIIAQYITRKPDKYGASTTGD